MPRPDNDRHGSGAGDFVNTDNEFDSRPHHRSHDDFHRHDIENHGYRYVDRRSVDSIPFDDIHDRRRYRDERYIIYTNIPEAHKPEAEKPHENKTHEEDNLKIELEKTKLKAWVVKFILSATSLIGFFFILIILYASVTGKELIFPEYVGEFLSSIKEVLLAILEAEK